MELTSWKSLNSFFLEPPKKLAGLGILWIAARRRGASHKSPIHWNFLWLQPVLVPFCCIHWCPWPLRKMALNLTQKNMTTIKCWAVFSFFLAVDIKWPRGHFGRQNPMILAVDLLMWSSRARYLAGRCGTAVAWQLRLQAPEVGLSRFLMSKKGRCKHAADPEI